MKNWCCTTQINHEIALPHAQFKEVLFSAHTISTKILIETVNRVMENALKKYGDFCIFS